MVGGARRAAGRASIRAFAEIYLPHHFSTVPSPMHLEVFEELEKLGANRGTRLAIAAPRGHAKSTLVSLAYALWCVCYETEPYILLVSDTAEQARDALKALKDELRGNARIESDFAHILEARRVSARWRRDDIVVGEMRVTALGADQKVRGRKNASSRPTLIIADDLENDELVRSPDQRERRREWFTSALMKSGTPRTNAVVIGTVLHHEALLARLLDPARSPGWLVKRYKAVTGWADRGDLWEKWESVYNHHSPWPDGGELSGPGAARAFFAAHRDAMLTGARALWPEARPYEHLMELKVREGAHSFATEMQNEPSDPATRLFRDEDIRFWDDARSSVHDFEGLRVSLEGHTEVICACDPALGKPGRGRDDSAIVIVLRESRTKHIYVIDADIRRRNPDETIEAILAYDRVRRLNRVVVEATQFQEMLVTELEKRAQERGRYLRVKSVKPTTDKHARIAAIQPQVCSGQVRFSQRHTALLEQLRQFPHGAHDDGLDALQMAVAAARKPEARVVGLSLRGVPV